MHLTTLAQLGLLTAAVSALPKPYNNPAKSLAFPVSKRLVPKPGLDKRDAFATPLTNLKFLYQINVTFGTPPQPLSLVLDTGSSNIWAYAPESSDSCPNCTLEYFDYTKSSTWTQEDSLGVFNISYGTPNSGVLGVYGSDQVTIAGVSVEQIISVATVAHEGDPPGGIFGVGLPEGESRVQEGLDPYPGYLDSLVSAGIIDVRAYSIFLNSENSDDTDLGQIVFGGYNSDDFEGDLVPVPIITPGPDGVYRLDVAEPAITVNLNGQTGDIPAVNSQYVVLPDTGTAISRIPEAQFAVIGQAVGAQIIDDGPIYAVDCSLATADGGIDFTFAGNGSDVTISVPWTELVLTDDTLPSGYCDFGLAPQTDAEDPGTYILGDTVLRSMYLLYNFDDGYIGIAQAKFNNTSNAARRMR